MSHREILKIVTFSFLFVCIINQTTAHVFTDRDGVTVKYKVTMGSFCGNEGESFSKFVGIPLAECVKECGMRQHCEGLRYHRRYTLCELLSGLNDGPQTDRSCIFIPASDIVVEQNPCQSCGDEGKACNVERKKCEFKECKDVNKDSWLRGNMRNVGNKIMQKCDEGYNYSVCLNDGTWSNDGVCEPLINVALGKHASMSSNFYSNQSLADLGVDGDLLTYFHTRNERNPWWLVDLGSLFEIIEVKVFNRDGFFFITERAKNLSLQLGMTMNSLKEYGIVQQLGHKKRFLLPANTFARYVQTQIYTTNYFHLTEVQVLAVTA